MASQTGKSAAEQMVEAQKLSRSLTPQGDTTLSKMKSEPLVPLGIAAWCGVVGYGVYNFRKRSLPLSVYVMRFRVYSQSMVVAACLGMVGWQVSKRAFSEKPTEGAK